MSMSAAYEDRKAERKSKLESREERICFIVSPMDVLEFSEIWKLFIPPESQMSEWRVGHYLTRYHRMFITV